MWIQNLNLEFFLFQNVHILKSISESKYSRMYSHILIFSNILERTRKKTKFKTFQKKVNKFQIQKIVVIYSRVPKNLEICIQNSSRIQKCGVRMLVQNVFRYFGIYFTIYTFQNPFENLNIPEYISESRYFPISQKILEKKTKLQHSR